MLTHLLGQDLDDLTAKIAAYRAAVAERAAGDGWAGHVVLMVHTFLGADESETRELVRGPMSDYLRSSLGLLLSSQVDGGQPVDPAKLRPEEIEFLVGRAFDKHYNDGGLLGTVDKVCGLVNRYRDMGVDEIACLIDFGVPTAAVLARLGAPRRAAADVAGRRAGAWPGILILRSATRDTADGVRFQTVTAGRLRGTSLANRGSEDMRRYFQALNSGTCRH